LWADFSWEIGLHLKSVAGVSSGTGFTGGNLAFQILRLLGGVFEGGLFSVTRGLAFAKYVLHPNTCDSLQRPGPALAGPWGDRYGTLVVFRQGFNERFPLGEGGDMEQGIAFAKKGCNSVCLPSYLWSHL
jgi:hypothetical protein